MFAFSTILLLKTTQNGRKIQTSMHHNFCLDWRISEIFSVSGSLWQALLETVIKCSLLVLKNMALTLWCHFLAKNFEISKTKTKKDDFSEWWVLYLCKILGTWCQKPKRWKKVSIFGSLYAHHGSETGMFHLPSMK